MRHERIFAAMCVACAVGVGAAEPASGPGGASAAHVTGVQVSLTPSRQLCPAQTRVEGLRVAFFGGTNSAVTGLDLGGPGLLAADSLLRGLQVGLTGCEAKEASGLQATLGSARCERGRGSQLALAHVAAAEQFSGLQFAAGLARSKKIDGVQLSLFGCDASSGTVRGLQAAFCMCVTRAGDLDGVQMAAGFCTAGKVTGAQVGLVFNHAESVRGIQLGLVNVCTELRGLQVGLINICEQQPGPFLPLLSARF